MARPKAVRGGQWFKPVRVQLVLTPRLEELDAAIARLDAVANNPQFLGHLLRQVVAETILKAWQERMLAKFGEIINTERETGAKRPVSGPALDQAKDAFAAAADALTQAQRDGKGTKRLEKALEKAADKLQQASGRARPSELSTGEFRKRALQIVRLLGEVSTPMPTKNGLAVGLGHLPTLNAINTPSATMKLTGHETESDFNTLWRHLEFGTGMYASNKTWNAGSPHRASNGGWWYGPRPGFGMWLKGSKGAHAIFDPASGVPYAQDALRFEQQLLAALAAALRGQ